MLPNHEHKTCLQVYKVPCQSLDTVIPKTGAGCGTLYSLHPEQKVCITQGEHLLSGGNWI